MDKQMLSTFMEVTACESQADAVHLLGSCHWNLDEAINLYFSNGAGGSTEPPSGSSADADPILLPEEDVLTKEEKEDDDGNSTSNGEGYAEYSDEDYDNMSYNTDEDDDDDYYGTIVEETEGGRPAVQPPSQSESLRDLFQPPRELMHRGSFHDAKVHAAWQDRFLLVNLQVSSGAGEFPSQMQNRDLWADEAAKQVVGDSFVFFLLQKESSYAHLDEGAKLAALYKLQDDQLPAVLVVDPITGQLLARRSGTMTPDEFVQFVGAYVEAKPSVFLSMPKFVKKTPVVLFPASVGGGGEQELACAFAAAAVEQEPLPVSESPVEPADDEVGVGEQELEIPMNSASAGDACSEQEHAPVLNTADELPAETTVDDDDEPMEGEEMYRLRIRFPNGTVFAKEFGCKRRVASLFAFCRSALRHDGEQHAEEKKAIRIMRFAGRALVAIQDDDAGATFEDLGLNCTAVFVVFDA